MEMSLDLSSEQTTVEHRTFGRVGKSVQEAYKIECSSFHLLQV